MRYRADLAKKVLKLLLNGDSVLLVAPSGMGKSRFVRDLVFSGDTQKLAKGRKIFFVNVNLDDLPQLSALEIYRLSLKRAFDQIEQERLKITIPDEEKNLVRLENNPSLLLEKLRTTFRMLCVAGHSVIFSIDGLGRLVETQDETFFSNLKSLRDYCSADKFTFLLCAKREPGEEDLAKIRPIYKLFSPFILFMQPLDKKDSGTMIKDIANSRELQVSKKMVGEIVKMSGGYPTLIKGLVLHLSQQTNSRDIRLDEKVLDSSAIMVRLDEAFNHLDYDEQETLRKLSISPDRVNLDDKNVKTLVRKGIVSQKGEIAIPLLSYYMKFVNNNSTAELGTGSNKIPSKAGLFLDPVTKRVYKNGNELHNLTKQEYRLLSFLNLNMDKICDREEIIQAVWEIDENSGISDEAVDQLVTRLRSKIENNKSNPQHLITIRGRGFSFKP